MSIEILLITVVLVAMLYLWHIDRSGDSERDELVEELKRRIEDLKRLLDGKDAEIAQLKQVIRILQNRPERRPKVTPSQQPAVEQAAPEPEPVELDSEAKRAEAKRLRSTGMIYREIGQALGVSPMTAHRWCNDDRQRDPEPEPTPEPEPEQATQTELALERARKQSRRKVSFNKYTRPLLVRKARKLHARGFSFVEIGEMLNISRTCAARYVRGTYTRDARAEEYERTRQQRRGNGDDSGDGEQA